MKLFLCALLLAPLFTTATVDTTRVHLADGKTTDWDTSRLITDNSSGFRYAFENDGANLYGLLVIQNPRMQFKLMREGMQLFLDPKEKKKESKGIEFPVKQETGSNDVLRDMDATGMKGSGDNNNPEQRAARLRSSRAMMALRLNALRLFGFGGNKNDEQGLKLPGSVNIGFDWDKSDVMYIEYTIPYSLLGGQVTAGTEWEVGWKVAASEHSGTSSAGEGGGRHGSYAGSGAGRGGHREFNGVGGNQNSEDYGNVQDTRREQSFWTKYTFRQ
ncbi:MAG TPA: hypothetical protein VGC95_09925 [Chitinophagaceae bacterium]